MKRSNEKKTNHDIEYDEKKIINQIDLKNENTMTNTVGLNSGGTHKPDHPHEHLGSVIGSA